MPTKLQYAERSYFFESRKYSYLVDFDLLSHEGINVVIWFQIGAQQKDRQDSQTLNNDTFYRPPLRCVQCIIESEEYPDADLLLKYDDHE